MKRLLLGVFCLFVFHFVQAQTTLGPRKVDGGVLFSYKKVGIKKVYLSGSFNDWARKNVMFRLKRNSSGIWWIVLNLKPGRYSYKFIVDDKWCSDPCNPSKSQGFGNSVIVVTEEKVIFPKLEKRERELLFFKERAVQSAEWIKKVVIYEMFIRVFTKEGTFRAAMEKLPYLKKLGVNVLWLMPIQVLGEKKKKGTLGSPYSVKDYRKINSRLGTEEDFRLFVKKAHNMGFKVILDWVANHSSWDNWMIEKHPEWYTKDKNGKIIPPVSDWSDVADFNYKGNPDNDKGLRKYMRESLVYWVKEFDVDGFRCDVAGMVPYDFWKSARKALLQEKKDILLLAESEDPKHHRSFDLTYEGKVRSFIQDVFENAQGAHKLKNLYRDLERSFPKNSIHMRWIENHDQIRAITYFNRETIYPASALIFGLDGVPLLYAGQEFGDTKWKDWRSLFDKMTLDWENFDEKLFQHYQTLILLRKEPALCEGKVIFLKNNQKAHVVTFLRVKDKEKILVAVNLSSSALDVVINIQKYFSSREISCMNLFSKEKLKRDVKNFHISFSKYGYAYFKFEKE